MTRTSTPATYLYCLVANDLEPSLAKLPRGLAGLGRPRTLAAWPGLWLIVADAPSKNFNAAAIERGLRDLEWVSAAAVAHETMAGHFLTRGVVLPVKLFTLFADDERAVKFVASQRRALAASVKRLRGCWEWGLRITLSRQLPAPKRATPRSGAAFLVAKRQQRDAPASALGLARRKAGQLYGRLAKAAVDSTRQPAAKTAGKLVLDGAFLIAIAKGSDFKRRVEHEAREARGAGLELTLTGPWPAYNFA